MLSLLNSFRTEHGHCVACRRKWRLTDTDLCPIAARPRWCHTLSNPVLWQSWMAAYPGYTLQMKTLFCGWPIMVRDTPMRRRSYCWTLIGNPTQRIQPLRVTPNLGSRPPFWNSGAFVIITTASCSTFVSFMLHHRCQRNATVTTCW